MNNLNEITLDNLFREAKAAAKRITQRKKEIVPLETPLTTWTNPDNWKHSRYLIVISRETETALGLYSELLHTKQPNCRRLIAVDPQGIKADAIEYVSGTWVQSQDELHLRPEATHKHIEATLTLRLIKLDSVTAHNVPVDLHFAFGKLAGMRLLQDTTFGHDLIIYDLPKGVDIFLLLSQSSIALAQEYYHVN